MTLMVVLALSAAGLVSADSGEDEKDTTSAGKVEQVKRRDSQAIARRDVSDGSVTIASEINFYLDALATVPYNGSYSDVYLSSGWDTTCGFWACGNTLQYEYTRTVWYGSDPWNAYSMQLNNKWKQNGYGATNANCTISYPLAASCTVSGTGSKTVTKTGPTWNYLWSVYNEFFEGVVEFSDFTFLGSLSETATSTICYYPGQCQVFQASDSN